MRLTEHAGDAPGGRTSPLRAREIACQEGSERGTAQTRRGLAEEMTPGDLCFEFAVSVGHPSHLIIPL